MTSRCAARPPRSPVWMALAVALAGLLAAGCSGVGFDEPEIGPPDRPPGTTVPATVTGTVTVLAAPVLTEVLTELGDRFELANPGATVVSTFTSVPQILVQLGTTPADVVVADDATVLAGAVNAGTLGATTDVATVALELAVPPGNPGGIQVLADLERPDLTVALCVPEAPCGRRADEALAEAGVVLTSPRREADVKAVIAAVTSALADVGIVYATDVVAADVDGVALPGLPPATIAVSPVTAAANAQVGEAFAAYLRTPEAQQVFSDFGFTPAP